MDIFVAFINLRRNFMLHFIKAVIKSIFISIVSITAVQATTIDYTATELGSNRWRYDYTVTNDTLASPLEEFTIFYDELLYGQLLAVVAPGGWEPLAIQPDIAIPAAGFFDALALNGGIAALRQLRA